MKREVLITLDVPDDFKGTGRWSAEESLDSYVAHWLEQGYYIDYGVELPGGIEYKGFELVPLCEENSQTRK